jgi:hypothetical protein
MRYRVCDECGTVQRDLEATCRWHVLTPDLLEAELAAAKGRQP